MGMAHMVHGTKTIRVIDFGDTMVTPCRYLELWYLVPKDRALLPDSSQNEWFHHHTQIIILI